MLNADDSCGLAVATGARITGSRLPLEALMAKLECSKSTLQRTFNALKDYLNARVVFDTEAGGYAYAKEAASEMYALPGLWFMPRELQALAGPGLQTIRPNKSPEVLQSDDSKAILPAIEPAKQCRRRLSD